MPESRINLISTGIPVLITDGTQTGVYLYLDSVKSNGIAKIITRWNFTEERQTNESDNTEYTKYTYQEAWIAWSLPGFYTKDGVITQLGTTDENGCRVITEEQVKNYITANAVEIAGFGQTSKLRYVG